MTYILIASTRVEVANGDLDAALLNWLGDDSDTVRDWQEHVQNCDDESIEADSLFEYCRRELGAQMIDAE